MENSAWTILGKPEGSTQTVRNIMIISVLMFPLIVWLHPFFGIIAVPFFIVGVLNAMFAIKPKGYFAVSPWGIEHRNNYLPFLNKSFSFDEMGLVRFRHKRIKGGILHQVEFMIEGSKKKTCSFEADYRAHIIQVKQLIEAKGISTHGEIAEKPKNLFSFGNNSILIYMPILMLGQLVVVAGIFGYISRENEATNQSIVDNPAFAVATTSNIIDPNHGSCRFVYHYEVDGKIHKGESSICVDCSANADSLYQLRDVDLAVEKAGAKFMVVYKKDEPSVHRFLLNRYVNNPSDSVKYVAQGISMEDLD